MKDTGCPHQKSQQLPSSVIHSSNILILLFSRPGDCMTVVTTVLLSLAEATPCKGNGTFQGLLNTPSEPVLGLKKYQLPLSPGWGDKNKQGQRSEQN